MNLFGRKNRASLRGEIPAPARPTPGQTAPKREELTLPDGYVTSVYIHRPAKPVAGKQPVLYLHGIQSHPGWFHGSAHALVEAGHTVFQLTRRGSGDNQLLRGQVQAPKQLLADVRGTLDWIREQTGFGRVHLVAVSWGGKVAAAAASEPELRTRFASVTLVAPGLASRVDAPATTKLGVSGCKIAAPLMIFLLVGIAAVFWPLLPLGFALLVFAALLPLLRFPIPLQDAGLFTDDPGLQNYIRTDPATLHRVTAQFLYTSRRLDALLAARPSKSILAPTTLILAERDRIIDNAKTRRLSEWLCGDQLHVEQLPGAHTLEFESDPSRLYQTLRQAVRRGE